MLVAQGYPEVIVLIQQNFFHAGLPNATSVVPGGEKTPSELIQAVSLSLTFGGGFTGSLHRSLSMPEACFQKWPAKQRAPQRTMGVSDFTNTLHLFPSFGP